LPPEGTLGASGEISILTVSCPAVFCVPEELEAFGIVLEHAVAARHNAAAMAERVRCETTLSPEFGITEEPDFPLNMATLISEVGDFSLSSPAPDSKEGQDDRPDHRCTCPNK
jgi:hypothetical protein